MQKIIIFGSQGNLGTQLIKVFTHDYEVIAWDKNEIDITDETLVSKKINEIKPAIIINAAAYNNVDKCEDSDQEYELAKKVNIDGPKFIARACLKIGSSFIHYSTDYVFGNSANEANGERIKRIKEQGGFREDDQPCPVNRYGKTKFHGEKRILELNSQGLKYYLIRTSKLFGPKADSPAAKPSFFDMMLEISKNKKQLEVVDEEVSCFTYTPDLAQATRNLLTSNAGFGIYHLTNSDACTWYQAAKELFKLTGQNIKIIAVSANKFPRPAKRPKYSVLLNTKLGPLRSWQEALAEYLKLKNNL